MTAMGKADVLSDIDVRNVLNAVAQTRFPERNRIMFLLSICGCDNSTLFGGDCMNIIFLLLLLSCCGCSNNTPCGN